MGDGVVGREGCVGVTCREREEGDELVSNQLTSFFSSVTKYIILQYPPPCLYCRKGCAALDGDTRQFHANASSLTIFSQASTNVCFPAESMMQSSWRGKARREGKGRGVIHGDLVKLHGFKRPIVFGNAINVHPTRLPYCLLNTDEKLTVLNVLENVFHGQ